MSTDENVLLKEVDEDLAQEEQIAFLKRFGPWLLGASLTAVIGVGVYQAMSKSQQTARDDASIAYRAAVEESTSLTGASAADAMVQFAEQVDGGYGALADLRAAGLFLAANEQTKALDALARVYGDETLPMRLRDAARLRAATVQLDEAPTQAAAIANVISTDAFAPYAREIEGLAAMSQGNYAAAYDLFLGLKVAFDTPAPLAGRAAILLPLADAGRAGVTLAPASSEAESFIESFSNQLEDQGLVGEGLTLPPVPAQAADQVAPEVTPEAAVPAADDVEALSDPASEE